jgi:hypothetical protein
MKRTFSILLAVLLPAVSAIAQGIGTHNAGPRRSAGVSAAGGGEWKMKITFGGYSNRIETLTNFPALVVFSNGMTSAGTAFNFADQPFAKTNGYDLRFWSGDEATELAYEIERWTNSAALNAFVWVRVPAITGSTDFIWAKWGEAAKGQQAYTTNGAAWDTNFLAVWHLNEAVSNNGTLRDATGNRYDLTFLNKGGSSTAGVNAVVGAGVHLYQVGNSGDCLERAASAALQVTNFTLSAWLKCDETIWNATMVCRIGYGLEPSGGAPSSSMRFRVTANSFNKAVDFDPGVSAIASWQYYVGTYCTAPQKQILYYDGVHKVQATDCPAPDGGNSIFRVGWATDGGIASSRTWFDEVRVDSVVRSSNWVWACWLNMASNQVFNRYDSLGH